MGKTRTAFVGDTTTEEKPKRQGKKHSLKEEKKVRVPGLKGGERVVAVGAEPIVEKTPLSTVPVADGDKKKIRVHKRGKNYLSQLSQVDPNKLYTLPEAVELAQKTAYSRFVGNVELHLNLNKKGLPLGKAGKFEATLPHQETLAQKRVEIASEETLQKLEQGKIDFDILLATSDFIPQLVKYAKFLGPRNLMPNPKNGTIVDDPKTALEKFSGSTQVLQTEKDFPLLHAVAGKTSEKTPNLIENIEAIFKTVGPANIQKAVVKATMGPGIKVAIS